MLFRDEFPVTILVGNEWGDAFSCVVLNVTLFMDEFPTTILVGNEWGDAFSCVVFNVMLFMDEFPASILVGSEWVDAFSCVVFNVTLFMDEFPVTILVGNEWGDAFSCVVFNVTLFMDEFPASILVGSEWVDAFLIGTLSWNVWRRWTSCQCAVICRRRRFSPKAWSTYTDASSSVVRLHNLIVLLVWGGGSDMLMFFSFSFSEQREERCFRRRLMFKCLCRTDKLLHYCMQPSHAGPSVPCNVFFPWTSVTYTSGHDYLDGEKGSCLMNAHWNTVCSNRQS